MANEKADRLINLGIHAEPALEIQNQTIYASNTRSVGTFAAAGSAIGDATDLTALNCALSTDGASKGVQLPEVTVGSAPVVLVHTGDTTGDDSRDILVYPADASEAINAASPGAAISLGNGDGLFCWKQSATQWYALRGVKES